MITVSEGTEQSKHRWQTGSKPNRLKGTRTRCRGSRAAARSAMHAFAKACDHTRGKRVFGLPRVRIRTVTRPTQTEEGGVIVCDALIH